jgi:ribosome-associated toxin RatA of RatAB toxin-antitoxin module
MTAYEATREIIVAASAANCFSVLTDYERMPEWQSRLTHCVVLARDEQGRGRDVEYEVDAKLRRVRYRLRHRYQATRWIGSEYLGGDFRSFEGDYELEEQDHGTRARLRLRIDPGLRLPGPVVRMLNHAVMGQSLEDLKQRMERPCSGA